MGAIGWYVTPATKPDTLLDGPFTTRAECQSRCVIALSLLNKQRAADNLSLAVTTYYIPHPIRLDTAAQPTASRVAVSPAPKPKTPPPPDVTAKLRVLSKGKLMRVAKTLSLEVPEHYSKQQIAALIHRTLIAASHQ